MLKCYTLWVSLWRSKFVHRTGKGSKVLVILFVSCLTTLVIVLIGLLVWGTLFLFKVRGIGKKIAKWTLGALVVVVPVMIFVVLPLLAAQLIAHSGTRPMDLELTVDPSSSGRDFSSIRFPARDGLELSGWWLRGSESREAFVLAHGLFRDRKEVLERACQLNRQGHGALLFDFRSHGNSETSTVSMGYHERLDVVGAVDWLVASGVQRVVVLGVSMGAVATLEASGELDSRVVALIADSPFLSLNETVSRHVDLWLGLPSFPFVNLFVWNFTRINGFDGRRLDVGRSAIDLPFPVLLIYGNQDERMPPETARSVFEAISSSRKSILFFEGARHGLAWKQNPDCYIEAIEAFLESRDFTCPGVQVGFDVSR